MCRNGQELFWARPGGTQPFPTSPWLAHSYVAAPVCEGGWLEEKGGDSLLNNKLAGLFRGKYKICSNATRSFGKLLLVG